MGRFFNEKVQNRNRSSKMGLIIICIIIVVILFIIAIAYNNSKAKKAKITYILNDSIYLTAGEDKPSLEDYFKEASSLTGVTINDSAVDMTNPGVYQVELTINNKKEIVMVIVEAGKDGVDINLTSYTIKKGEEYSVADFVTNCVDANGDSCSFTYADSNETDYSSYKEVGTYPIKIIAIDSKDIEYGPYETTLTIEDNSSPKKDPVIKTSCEFGSLDYDKNYYTFPLAYTVDDNNNCAADMKLWNDEKYSKKAADIFNKDKERLNTEIESYLSNNKIYSGSAGIDVRSNNIAVLNKDGKGLVGYGVIVYVYVWDYSQKENADTANDLKLKYYIASDGSRSYSVNEYNFK